jgi:hypothetical protein
MRAARPLRSLSMAQDCARIDSRLDTAKIGSAGRLEVYRARLLAIIGVRKTFPHGLDPKATSAGSIEGRTDLHLPCAAAFRSAKLN